MYLSCNMFQFPDTEYDDRYIPLEINTERRHKPIDNLEEFRGLNFAEKTENSEYDFRPVSRNKGVEEYNNNR